MMISVSLTTWKAQCVTLPLGVSQRKTQFVIRKQCGIMGVVVFIVTNMGHDSAQMFRSDIVHVNREQK